MMITEVAGSDEASTDAKQTQPRPLQLTRAQESSHLLQEWAGLVAHPELQR